MKTVKLLLALFLLPCALPLCAATAFHDAYADAVWNQLTGFSSYQVVRYGERAGTNDYYVFLKNEFFDTHGTNLPFEYTTRGTTAGVGYRHWLLGNTTYAGVSIGEGIAGNINGDTDLRVGMAGYDEWRHDKQITDLYGEITWVEKASDTFLNVRPRYGYVLSQNPTGRLWTYGVGQLWASGQGDNGADNRIEAGPGIGYLYKGKATINLELRAGYSFRGTISDRSYLNPTVVIAGNF